MKETLILVKMAKEFEKSIQDNSSILRAQLVFAYSREEIQYIISSDIHESFGWHIR